jgi:predicted HicB family RNase H-like nuclease
VETLTAAVQGIRRLIAQVVTDMQASVEAVPEPLAELRHRGAFRVRIPPELHRGLSIRAAEQGASPNRLVSSRLAGGDERR